MHKALERHGTLWNLNDNGSRAGFGLKGEKKLLFCDTVNGISDKREES